MPKGALGRSFRSAAANASEPRKCRNASASVATTKLPRLTTSTSRAAPLTCSAASGSTGLAVVGCDVVVSMAMCHRLSLVDILSLLYARIHCRLHIANCRLSQLKRNFGLFRKAAIACGSMVLYVLYIRFSHRRAKNEYTN